MKQHPNFYENLREAQMRLRGTVVLYDGSPYQVLAICGHKPDGIFRVYLQDIGLNMNDYSSYPPASEYPSDHASLGPAMDTWMEANPKFPLLRKQMNSPLFNKFRPYPMGMCNYGTQAYYLQRQPNRKTEQGLIRSMIDASLVSSTPQVILGKGNTVELFSSQFKDCVLGKYPSPDETLKAMLDPGIENTAVGFHRDFALVRGPIGMLFLAYKTDTVGVLSNNDFTSLRLGRDFRHTREAIESLRLFASII